MISQCLTCANFIPRDEFICLAFPDGIPAEVFTNEHNHKEPYKNDNGIRYEESRINDAKPERLNSEN